MNPVLQCQRPAFYVIGCGLTSLTGLAMVPETPGRRLP